MATVKEATSLVHQCLLHYGSILRTPCGNWKKKVRDFFSTNDQFMPCYADENIYPTS